MIFRRTARHFVPWKNGGGRTAEILAAPAGAGVDDFAWRISTAEVAASGPFSIFPGVQRCLTVLEGGSLRLCFADGVQHEVSPGAAPVYFPGDVPCACELLGAPVLDLNVMVRPPLRTTVRPLNGSPGSAPDVLRHFLFALEDLPAFDLERYDLADITALTLPRRGHALLIEIL
jgi:environmental stress-induced protein Ves